MTSPCIRLCSIDAQTGLCDGCGRSLAEIGNWVRYSEAERREIMDALPSRRAAAAADRATEPAQ